MDGFINGDAGLPVMLYGSLRTGYRCERETEDEQG
jgi:hypothetical protein